MIKKYDERRKEGMKNSLKKKENNKNIFVYFFSSNLLLPGYQINKYKVFYFLLLFTRHPENSYFFSRVKLEK